jgi:O-antigen ligase/polysaccharide polymerase Wzy-like membrane protein
VATLATSMDHPATDRGQPLAVAYTGILAFILVYCARPEDWLPGAVGLPLAKFVGVFTMVAFGLGVLFGRRRSSRLPGDVVLLGLFFAQLCLTVPFSPVWRGGAFDTVFYGFSKVVAITVVVVIAASTFVRLRRLIFVQTASVALIALVTLWKDYRIGRGAGRLSGAIGGDFENPNDLALAIVLAWPFCFMFLLEARSLVKKSIWAIAIMAMSYAVVDTYSRGGFLALIVASGLCLWEFGVKGRRHYVLALIGVLGLGIILSLGLGNHWQRLRTIVHPDEDPTGSAQARQELLIKSLEVTAAHPIFGVGPGNFAVVSGDWHVAHNSYTQVSAEAGIPGLILFLLILRRSFYNIRETKRLTNQQPEFPPLASALHASLWAFVVGALFSSVPFAFFPYFVLAFTAALHRIASETGTVPGEPGISIYKLQPEGP